MNSIHFDYIIIGAGAAGLHLCFAMLDEPSLNGKRILLIDKDDKNSNDRTWCYWEQGAGKWDHLTFKVWEKGWFITDKVRHALNMHPYRYKMVRGIDFYNFGKHRVKESENVTWVKGDVTGVVENELVTVSCGDISYTAYHVFDSRIDDSFHKKKNQSVNVLQHFMGWMIETDTDVFNPDEFVMMDYRIKWENQTGFTYVLPSTSRKALVEFTFFTPQLVDKNVYEKLLKRYLSEILRITDYRITETEFGIIPMTNYNFNQHHSRAVTKIGTAGSWVKPSSGYSFKNAERFAQLTVANIKAGVGPASGIGKGRFRKYDTLFLEILQNKNELGEEIFTDMYLKNPTSRIFKFLDEQTGVIDDLKVISSFRPEPFRRALMKHWKAVLHFS